MLKKLTKNRFFLNFFANLVFVSLWIVKNTSKWKGVNEEIIEDIDINALVVEAIEKIVSESTNSSSKKFFLPKVFLYSVESFFTTTTEIPGIFHISFPSNIKSSSMLIFD